MAAEKSGEVTSTETAIKDTEKESGKTEAESGNTEKDGEDAENAEIPTQKPTESVSKEDTPKETPKKATFGGTLFPLSFKTTPSSDKPKAAGASHVFGATSSFGSSLMDKLKAKPSVFDALPSQSAALTGSSDVTPVASAQPSFGSSFGSNSTFGNAFQESLKKKSFLDDDGNKCAPETPKKDDSVAPQQYKQVDLAKKDIKTGEEDEESQFSCTAKIFELNFAKISEGWKERGVGPLHLNQSKTDRSQLRLVMRSQGLLRVVLNMKIAPNTALFKGLEASLSPGKFLRLNSVSEGKPVQYLLKFGSENTRNDLYDTVERLKGEIRDGKPAEASKEA